MAYRVPGMRKAGRRTTTGPRRSLWKGPTVFEKILFATDFSKQSRRAEDHALALARAISCPVLILHVVEAISGQRDPEVEAIHASLETRALAEMEKVVVRFHEAGVEHQQRVAIGRRWETILDVAEEEGCDLIVIGSHPTVRNGKPVIGTTSHKLFYASRIPLLVVRESDQLR